MALEERNVCFTILHDPIFLLFVFEYGYIPAFISCVTQFATIIAFGLVVGIGD